MRARTKYQWKDQRKTDAQGRITHNLIKEHSNSVTKEACQHDPPGTISACPDQNGGGEKASDTTRISIGADVSEKYPSEKSPKNVRYLLPVLALNCEELKGKDVGMLSGRQNLTKTSKGGPGTIGRETRVILSYHVQAKVLLQRTAPAVEKGFW